MKLILLLLLTVVSSLTTQSTETKPEKERKEKKEKRNKRQKWDFSNQDEWVKLGYEQCDPAYQQQAPFEINPVAPDNKLDYEKQLTKQLFLNPLSSTKYDDNTLSVRLSESRRRQSRDHSFGIMSKYAIDEDTASHQIYIPDELQIKYPGEQCIVIIGEGETKIQQIAELELIIKFRRTYLGDCDTPAPRIFIVVVRYSSSVIEEDQEMIDIADNFFRTLKLDKQKDKEQIEKLSDDYEKYLNLLKFDNYFSFEASETTPPCSKAEYAVMNSLKYVPTFFIDHIKGLNTESLTPNVRKIQELKKDTKVVEVVNYDSSDFLCADV